MDLTPLFENNQRDIILQVINENIDIVRTSLYGNQEQNIFDKLLLLERAVKINNEQDRNDYVSLIYRWYNIEKLKIESYQALVIIAKQLETLSNKLNNAEIKNRPNKTENKE